MTLPRSFGKDAPSRHRLDSCAKFTGLARRLLLSLRKARCRRRATVSRCGGKCVAPSTSGAFRNRVTSLPDTQAPAGQSPCNDFNVGSRKALLTGRKRPAHGVAHAVGGIAARARHLLAT